MRKYLEENAIIIVIEGIYKDFDYNRIPLTSTNTKKTKRVKFTFVL